VDPVPDPLLLRQIGSTGNRTWDLWICSQEPWPLDHRGGRMVRLCFPLVPSRVVVNKNSVEQPRAKSRVSRCQPAKIWAWEHGNWIESSLRNLQPQNNGRKGIRLRKEDFLVWFEWSWDCYNSVARIRLVKTENPNACVTVNCKVCRSAIALYCL
jgi:hypothetical protein